MAVVQTVQPKHDASVLTLKEWAERQERNQPAGSGSVSRIPQASGDQTIQLRVDRVPLCGGLTLNEDAERPPSSRPK